MSDTPITELYAECVVPLRLYRFMQKAYENIIGPHCPDALHDAISQANPYIFRELEDTLREVLTTDDCFNLTALLSALEEDHPQLFRS